ncbi:MAG: hypothetical protein OXU36_12115 [Candidatus Poribacteria bacterium]|nr:hypothetical protein [Candidatus Poribacteria bacterium]
MSKVLSDIFHVKGRFRRSIHLERDFYTDENLLEGYVVTVTALEMLERVASALENGESSKAWSLTGPYGSGKSAFALFTANLMGSSVSPIKGQALKLLEQQNTPLHKRFTNIKGNKQSSSFQFCPILISGERAPISLALLRSLQRGLASFNGISETKPPLPTIKKCLEAAEKGTLPNSSEIVKLFESAIHQIEEHEGTGLLLVIDEFGKFLEYASQYPAQGDIHVLQELAEFAERSGKTPLFLLTILHQAFEMYGQRTAKLQREEWAKIQGRFEDVPFTEPTEQLLRLVGKALEKSSEITCKDNFNNVTELGIKLHQLDDTEFIQLLESCLPLHPTVALLIGPLFRRFAQNERSLFTFLSSSEPYGLQHFLSNKHYDGNRLPMYRLANLYDYLNITQGNKLYTSGPGKKWAEIEYAINRLPDPPEIAVKLIKTIGLLGIAGEAINGLKASEKLLYYALDDNSKTFAKDFRFAITELKKHSIIIYRHYNDTFSIWEGSDIDIEAKLLEAETHVNATGALDINLSHYMPKRPLVAKRHLFDKGTLRYFTVRYTDLENFDVNLKESLEDADGLVLYALPISESESEQLRKKAKKVNREEVLIAIPNSIGSLQEAVCEVAKLRWVQQHISKLLRNQVARRELSARLIEAEEDVSRQLKAIFDEDNKSTCRWYHKGRQKKNISTHSVRNVYLSTICDQVYNRTPILRNELINRRKISGTVTAARRELIQAMLENGDQENLGITGYPPEMSIYRSLLLNSGIHRSYYHKWRFHPPKKPHDKNRMKHTWSAIEDFLTECENERKPIERLYKSLMASPYGIRRGPLPILLCAAILCYKTEVALYENDSFVPDLSMPVFERLLKVPKQFKLKRFRMTTHRTDVLVQYLKTLEHTSDTDIPNLLTVATPLMLLVARLPKYTLMTQALSENAKNLRDVVLDAHEPDRLLFHDLPKIMGYTVLGAKTDITPQTDQFFKAFQNALNELKQIYPSLLNSVQEQLAFNFSLEYRGEQLRRELINIAEPLEAVTRGTQLTGFLMRIRDTELDLDNWLEAIATFVVNKPPASWTDRDKGQFEINLSQLTRKFQHFKVLAYEKRKHSESSEDEPIRIGITRPNQPEQEWVVTLPLTTEKEIPKIGKVLKQALNAIEIDADPDLRSAILARISQEWRQQQEE